MHLYKVLFNISTDFTVTTIFLNSFSAFGQWHLVVSRSARTAPRNEIRMDVHEERTKRNLFETSEARCVKYKINLFQSRELIIGATKSFDYRCCRSPSPAITADRK